jgi:PAS domain S-box-containing protein
MNLALSILQLIVQAANTTYQQIFESIGEGILVLDDRGRIMLTNTSLESLFGYSKEELLEQPIGVLIPKRLREKHETLHAGFMQNPKTRKMAENKEFEALRKDGTAISVRVGLNYYEENGSTNVIAVVSDVTEKHIIEKRLQREKERVRLCLGLSNTIFVELDQNGNVKLVNQEGCKTLEYSKDEIVGKNWFDSFVPPEEALQSKDIFNAMMTGELEGVKFVKSKVISKSGKYKLIQWHNSLLKDENGKLEVMISSGVDITLQEQAQKAQTEAIIIGMERERKRVALDLHDGLVQTLSAISLNLKAMDDSVMCMDTNDQVAYKGALELLEVAISDTRSMSHDLMPAAIERYGFIKALEDFAVRTSKYGHLHVEIDPDHIDHYLNEFYRLNLYRIIQELIQNIIRHANATSAFIKIRKKPYGINIMVKDDGVGFDSSLEKVQQAGIGIRNIETRVKHMNGTLEVRSSSKKGTMVQIHVPVSY